MTHLVQRSIAGRTLSLETGRLAEQAQGSVLVRYGDSVVLVTMCFASEAVGGMDFVPLTVDYEEKLYAAGKIPGSFIRRESRPSRLSRLYSRQTRRPTLTRAPSLALLPPLSCPRSPSRGLSLPFMLA